MKKSIVLMSTIIGALSLTAFVIINQDEAVVITETATVTKDSNRAEAPANRLRQPFVYEMGSRFMATVTKEQIEKATNVHDLLPENADWSTYPVEQLNVTLERETKKTEIGTDMTLTDAQLTLLKSTRYSDNFSLVANGKQERPDRKVHDLVYYISVIPEKEAIYVDGKDKLMAYLKEKSAEAIADVEEKKLKPGQISFTISAKGTITNVTLEQSSGYVGIDARMVELLTNAPGNWTPAENAKGQKIAQDLFFFFGQMGC